MARDSPQGAADQPRLRPPVQPWRQSHLRLAIDAAVMVAVLAGFALVRGVTPNVWHAVFGVVAVGAMKARGAYDRRLEDSLVVVLVRHVVASALIATMATVTLRTLAGESTSSRNVAITFAVATLALGVTRVVGSYFDRRQRARGVSALRALVIGTSPEAVRIATRLQVRRNIGIHPVGFLAEESPERSATLVAGEQRLPILGGTDDFDDVVRRHRVDAIIVVHFQGEDAEGALSEIVARAHELTQTVFVVPRLHSVVNTRTKRLRVATLPVDELRPVDPRSREFQLKYAIDRVIGSLVVLLLLPVLGAIAAAVRLSSPGPVLFRQRRVGLDGREFDILKFRSMRQPAQVTGPRAAPEWAPESGVAPGGVEGDDRRTRVGRFLRTSNLDELPQLINIARGEMCIVGPRPERPEFVERFASEFHTYDARHRVKAGLTGWSQVHGLRGQTSIAERAEWDNYYIENWSFALDLAIVVRTVKTFFEGNE